MIENALAIQRVADEQKLIKEEISKLKYDLSMIKGSIDKALSEIEESNRRLDEASRVAKANDFSEDIKRIKKRVSDNEEAVNSIESKLKSKGNAKEKES